jgi:hypothetical protein
MTMKTPIKDRYPFRVLPLDLLGGGLPTGHCSLIYGPERSGKTLILLLGLKSFLAYSKLNAVIARLEGDEKLNESWMVKLGIPPADIQKRIRFLDPDFQETIQDQLSAALRDPTVGFVGADSWRSFTTEEGFAEDFMTDKGRAYAPEAKLLNSFYKKAIIYQGKRRSAGNGPCCLVATNHEYQAPPPPGGSFPIRMVPCGKGQLYFSTLRIHTQPSDYLASDKFSKMDIPTRVEIRFQIEAAAGPTITKKRHGGAFTMGQAGPDTGRILDLEQWWRIGNSTGYIEKRDGEILLGTKSSGIKLKQDLFERWQSSEKDLKADQDEIIKVARVHLGSQFFGKVEETLED